MVRGQGAATKGGNSDPDTYSLEVIRWGQPGDTIAEEASKNASIIMNAHIRSALASRNILQSPRAGADALECEHGRQKLGRRLQPSGMHLPKGLP